MQKNTGSFDPEAAKMAFEYLSEADQAILRKAHERIAGNCGNTSVSAKESF